jgi:signal transduction histidine kinase
MKQDPQFLDAFSAEQRRAIKQSTSGPVRLFSVVASAFIVSLAIGFTLLTVTQSRFNGVVKRIDEVNRHVESFDRLLPKIAAVEQPAREILRSKDEATQRVRLQFALTDFENELRTVVSGLAAARGTDRSDATIRSQITAVGLQTREAARLASTAIDAYAEGSVSRASNAVAQVDLPAGAAQEHLSRAKQLLYERNTRIVADQSRTAQRIRTIGLIMAVLAACSVGVVVLLWRRVARLQLVLRRERYEIFFAAKKSEAELRVFNRRLAESNRDLTDFAYVASHDLQEPLRKIIAFGDRLGSRFGDQLGADGMDYLARMQNASTRMQTLIEDLLTFSRVATRVAPFVSTPLAEVATGVVGDLEVAIERAKAVVEIVDLPTIDVDPSQMRQLMQNLIGNALKFRRDDVATYVRVSATRLPDAEVELLDLSYSCPDGWWALEVRDNGIGFEQKYAEKIFTVFQRLHGRSEYEGSGVGLAVVRRIAERHQGLVSVTSAPNSGTTFRIILPATQPRAVSTETAPATATPVPEQRDLVAV